MKGAVGMSESDYTSVTEIPGVGASAEQISRLFHRYRFASDFCAGKDVLEVACGSGIGLGYIAKTAKKVVGGDIDDNNLKLAREHYKGRGNVEICRLDAHSLPFADGSFDVVVFYEAVYYLARPAEFFGEVKRVLRKGGVFIICSVNKDWSDFNPSPLSVRYFSVPELCSLLKERFCSVNFFAAFSAVDNTFRGRVASLIKRAAVSLHMIPKTMKGKEIFKRIFFGRLVALPAEISDGMSEYALPVPIYGDARNGDYKVVYAVCRND